MRRQNTQNQQTPDPIFPAFVDKLKSLGAKPKDIGDPPTVAGSQGGSDVESAAAFDSYVQMKAKELGMDMATVLTTYGRGRAAVEAVVAAVVAAVRRCAAGARTRWLAHGPNDKAVSSIAGFRAACRRRWTSFSRSGGARC